MVKVLYRTLLFSFLVSTLKLIVSVFVIAISFVPLLLVFMANEIIRSFLKHVLKLELMAGPDAIYSFTDQCIIRSVCTFPIDSFNWEEFKKNVISEMSNHIDGGKMSKILKTRYFYRVWEPAVGFNPENHFRTIGQKEGEKFSEKDLNDWIVELGQPFQDKRKPRWELILVPVMPDGVNCGVIIRIEHSYADGISTIANATQSQPDFPYFFSPYENPYPTVKSKIFFNLKSFLFMGWGLLVLPFREISLSWSRYSIRKYGRIYNAASFKLPTNDLKFIAKSEKGNFNAVMLQTFEQAMIKRGVKEDLCKLVVTGGFPYRKGELQNKLGLLAVPKGAVNLSPAELAVHTRPQSNETYFVGRFLHRQFMGRMPSFIIKLVSFTFKNGLVCTNIPFSKENFSLFNFPLVEETVFVNIWNGLNITMLTIKDVTTIGVTCSGTILKEGELAMVVSDVNAHLCSLRV